MNLANNTDFSGVPPGSHRSLDDPGVRASVVGALQGNLQVSLVPRTEMIDISYSSLSPKLSADIVNKVIEDYRQWSYQTPVESTRRVSQWLSGQLEELKAEVEQIAEADHGFAAEAGDAGVRFVAQPVAVVAGGVAGGGGQRRRLRASTPNRATGWSRGWTRIRSKARSR